MGRILFLLSLLLLSSCGNIDRGKTVRTSRAKTDGVSATAAIPTSGAAYAACQSLAVSGGTNPNVSQNYGGLKACASTSQLNLVLLKTSANLPTTTRYCLVPTSLRAVFTATCFSINGQAEITLSTEQFSGVTFVRESDLATYVAYLNGQSAAYPPLAYANLR